MTRAVFTWQEIASKFRGTFVIPVAQEGDFRFGYSRAIHAQLANGNLLVDGHSQYRRQAEVRLPATLDGSPATRVGPWVDITDGLHPQGWSGGDAYILGGLLELDDSVYFTKHQWYNGGGTDWDSLGYRHGGVAHGMWNIDHPAATNQRAGGYMSNAPQVIGADGYPFLVGQQGTSGAASGRHGPNLFAIRFDPSLPAGASMPAKPLLYHDTAAHRPPGWWTGDRVTGIQWIETATHHAVLVVLHQGVGCNWYGEADQPAGACTRPAPYGGYKGYHAEGYRLKVWIYDPDDLLAVYRGEREPWSVLPREEVVLIERLPGATSDVQHSVISGRAKQELQLSWRAGRLIILQPDGHRPGPHEGLPKGYVFQLE